MNLFYGCNDVIIENMMNWHHCGLGDLGLMREHNP